MKCVLAILALFSASAAAVSNEELLNQFSGFKARFGKVYPSQEEEHRRFLIFTENVLEAERHNRGECDQTVLYHRSLKYFSQMVVQKHELMT